MLSFTEHIKWINLGSGFNRQLSSKVGLLFDTGLKDIAMGIFSGFWDFWVLGNASFV